MCAKQTLKRKANAAATRAAEAKKLKEAPKEEVVEVPIKVAKAEKKEKTKKGDKNEKKISAGGGKTVKKSKSASRTLWVIKIKSLPYGFFEDQLSEYFRQFGTVVRVRVARSRKTGNHKGWAYVGFDNKDVAEIAAETMNGYLMFNHRLRVYVMKPSTIPKSMRSGPMIVSRPAAHGLAKKDAVQRNNNTKDHTGKRQNKLKKSLESLRAMGIDYDLPMEGEKPPIVESESEDDEEEHEDEESEQEVEEEEPEIVVEEPKKEETPKQKTPKQKTPKQKTPVVEVPEVTEAKDLKKKTAKTPSRPTRSPRVPRNAALEAVKKLATPARQTPARKAKGVEENVIQKTLKKVETALKNAPPEVIETPVSKKKSRK
ncbi:unnamed protein product [Caenorhabditis auriculariae]|uniref:RRM domain-containing protein n=1 Tax=Caenorhabditis auriculariae TaxID=2777116 RepID=A0A8S1HUH5_9PELO|nr:unnamed protein product [Caenorhabditis auriculariae]